MQQLVRMNLAQAVEQPGEDAADEALGDLPRCVWMNSCSVRPRSYSMTMDETVSLARKKLSTRMTLGWEGGPGARPSSKKHFIP